MDAEDPSAVLKDVLSTQRSIIKNTYGEEDAVHRKPKPTCTDRDNILTLL